MDTAEFHLKWLKSAFELNGCSMSLLTSIRILIDFCFRSAAMFIVLHVGMNATMAAEVASFSPIKLENGPARGIMWIANPTKQPRGIVIVMPGAQMPADRYTWLADGLAAEDYNVILVEAEVVWRSTPGVDEQLRPTRIVSVAHFLAALDYARGEWPEVTARNTIAVGHSLGAAVVLEVLDPEEASRNPWNPPPEGYLGVDGIAAAVILGSTLQANVGGFSLEYRSDDRPLNRPPETRLLFVAAENDGMAPPEMMRKTASRYEGPVEFAIVDGGNHLGWSEGRGPMDRPDMDLPATAAPSKQRSDTLDLILQFLN